MRVVDYGDSSDVIFELPVIEWHSFSVDSFPDISQPYLYEKGAPELPRLAHTFLFKEARQVRFRIVSYTDTFFHASISPSQGAVSWAERDAPRIQGEIYTQNNYFPDTCLMQGADFRMRDSYGYQLLLHPFQYHPINHELRCFKTLTVRVYHPRVVLKSAHVVLATTPNEERMLVIAPDSFYTPLLPFLQWKNQLGVETYFVNADTVNSLYALVSDYYQKEAIDYLLLVGGITEVNTAYSAYGAGDNNLGYVSGSDPYLDVFVGRLPVSSVNDLSVMTAKLMAYEQGRSITERITHYVGIASSETTIGDDGEQDIEHIQVIADSLAHIAYTTEVLSPLRLGCNMISNAVNAGAGLMCYAGHGNETQLRTFSYNQDSMLYLKNKKDHPFFIDVACLNGAFVAGDCFATRLMKTHVDQQPVGVVGIVASTISQPWKPPMRGQDVMVHKVIESRRAQTTYTLGQIVADGLYDMINAYGDGGIETAVTWNLFGDPSLRLWSAVPDTFIAECADTFNIRNDAFRVTGEEGVMAAFSANGQVLDKGTIVNGELLLYPGKVAMTDALLLTFSKPAFVPIIKEVTPYYNGGTYYGMSDFHVEENNGYIESGELVQFFPHIVNFGDTLGQDITIVMSSLDERIQIIDSLIRVLTLAPKDTLALQDGFRLRIADNLSDLTTLSVNLKVSDAKGQMNELSTQLIVGAPVVELSSLSVSDVITENGELVFSRDTLYVSQVVSNRGHAPAENLHSELVCASPYVTLVAPARYSYGLAPMVRDTIVYSIIIHPNMPKGDCIDLSVVNAQQSMALRLVAYHTRVVQVGESTVSVKEYPFYNYYKNNKTQIIVRADELPSLGLVDSIGLYISAYPNVTSYTLFKNLTIGLGTCERDEFNYSYVEDPTLLKYTASYYLPRHSGWCYFDVEDFTISGDENILMSLTWGANSYYAPLTQSYEVWANSTSFNSVVLGYHDSQSPPNMRKVSTYRPNLRFVPKAVEIPSFELRLKDALGAFVRDFTLQIGSLSAPSDIEGKLELSLASGDYRVYATEQADTVYAGWMSVTDTTEEITLVAGGAFPVEVAPSGVVPEVYYAHDAIHLDGDFAASQSWTIYDMKGVVILHSTLLPDQHEVDVSALTSGIYLFKRGSTILRFAQP